MKLSNDILNIITEHTGGGFIIFFVDGEGRPAWEVRVDNITLAKGLISYIEDTIEGIREIDKISRVTELSDNGEEE